MFDSRWQWLENHPDRSGNHSRSVGLVPCGTITRHRPRNWHVMYGNQSRKHCVTKTKQHISWNRNRKKRSKPRKGGTRRERSPLWCSFDVLAQLNRLQQTFGSGYCFYDVQSRQPNWFSYYFTFTYNDVSGCFAIVSHCLSSNKLVRLYDICKDWRNTFFNLHRIPQSSRSVSQILSILSQVLNIINTFSSRMQKLYNRKSCSWVPAF